MQLGYVTAILPDWTLEENMQFAAKQGFDCLEVMCWPVGKAERRYAGVTHIDVTNFTQADAERVKGLMRQYNINISSLGYYPNPLVADAEERQTYVDHIKKVIAASAMLGINTMTTFVGRDPVKTIDDQWGDFEAVWKPLIAFAESQNVRVGIENCPMLFTWDEWPGGKNLAISPDVWRRMFDAIPSANFGLNFDPSHLIWQHIDYIRCIREFGGKFIHVHAKDTKIDSDLLYQHGIMGVKWHRPKLPGLGDVNWGSFFSVLNDVGYKGPVCIEVEDRAYEGSQADVERSIVQSRRYLEQFMR
ncbi:MAG: sugar phosphate isomerase/epimerase [Chloroflexi bacterium]|nr:sugar phosphate isomerase/epimerase [Chloroflexota bacterium]MCC6896563.1 TIM barrel protein [Anaerolineae bacterium]